MLSNTTWPVKRSHCVFAKDFLETSEIMTCDSSKALVKTGPGTTATRRYRVGIGAARGAVRPDRDRSGEWRNRSLVLGAILRSFPGGGCGRVTGTVNRPGPRDEIVRSPIYKRTPRQSLHGSTAPTPFGIEVSETLCPMFRLVVKNAENPAHLSQTQARPPFPGGAETPRVAFLDEQDAFAGQAPPAPTVTILPPGFASGPPRSRPSARSPARPRSGRGWPSSRGRRPPEGAGTPAPAWSRGPR